MIGIMFSGAVAVHLLPGTRLRVGGGILPIKADLQKLSWPSSVLPPSSDARSP